MLNSGSGAEQKVYRINIEQQSDSLHRLERQIALTTLDTTHVRAVDAEHFGEGFLAQAAGFAVVTKVATESSLQVAFHPSEASGAAT